MKAKRNIPPPLAQRILVWFLRDELAEEVQGDLEEKFYSTLKTKSFARAKMEYWYQVVHYLRLFAMRKRRFIFSNHYLMYKSYLKIGWRNLLKHKGYSIINIGGLAAGLAVALLIGMWIQDELSFNKNFENYERIARVMQNQTFNGEVETWQSQARQIAPALREKYGSDFRNVVMSVGNGEHKLTFNNNSISKKGNFMEPEVTELLSLHMEQGTRDGLADPYSILLSTSAAKAIFGGADPLEKMIRLDDRADVKVTGVYSDLPFNSSFSNLEFIAPWQLILKLDDLERKTGWGNSWFECFVQIAEGADMENVSLKIRDTKLEGTIQAGTDDNRWKPEIFLHPMPRWHLYSDFKNGVPIGGRIQYVWLFGIVGIFVLLLACINFMNLSTARSEKRAKEVGIRKTIGSIRRQLISQFFTESILVVVMAFAISLLLVQLALPWFNDVSNKQIYMPWQDPAFWIVSLFFILITGLVAGSFPALYLSSFEPTRALKGAFRAGKFASVPRKILVVVQFTVSITLIAGTAIVFKQIKFAQNRPIGYNNRGLIYAPIKTDEIRKHFAAFQHDLKKTGVVTDVALTDTPVTATYVTNSGFTWKDKDPAMAEEFVTLRVTHDFGKTLGWHILEGRDFSEAFPSDSMAFVINESAARYMKLENPVGETLTWGSNGEYKIIGVIKDLVTQSPYSPVKQMLFFLHYKRVYFVNVRINPAVSAHQAMSEIEPVFKKYDPANPFEFTFADQEHAKKFGNEERIATLAAVFTAFAILISCLGLFGLASFTAEKRTKEIGIRKVLGASAAGIWQMLSKDFVVLVTIACFVAIPLSYSFMNDWLEKYEYRTNIPWWIFPLTAAGAVLITLLTVSFHALKAAWMNPVNSLRSE